MREVEKHDKVKKTNLKPYPCVNFHLVRSEPRQRSNDQLSSAEIAPCTQDHQFDVSVHLLGRKAPARPAAQEQHQQHFISRMNKAK